MDQTASEILGALSRELKHLAHLTSSLQEQLSPRGYEGLDIEAFQSIDSLNQTLDCLATYTAQLGAVVPCECTVPIDEAADTVCLGALAERLRGSARPHAKMAESEVELF